MKYSILFYIFTTLPVYLFGQQNLVQLNFTHLLKPGLEAGYTRSAPSGWDWTATAGLTYFFSGQHRTGTHQHTWLENTVTDNTGQVLVQNFAKGKPFKDYGRFNPQYTVQLSAGVRKTLFEKRHFNIGFQPMLDTWWSNGRAISTDEKTILSEVVSTCCDDNPATATDVTIVQKMWFENRVLESPTTKMTLGVSGGLGIRWNVSPRWSLEMRGTAGANFLYPDSRVKFAAFDRYYYRLAGQVGFRFGKDEH